MMKTIATTQLPAHVLVPTYDRNCLVTKIVHFGFGAFHRAHQGVYTDELASQYNSDWGICEVSLFSGKPLLEQLQQQQHLYSVVEKNTAGPAVKVIGCVRESMHPALDGKQAIINKMTEPQVAIMSLTITEKGYCSDTNTGQLDALNPMIQQDLQTPLEPNSVIGYLVQALRVRRNKGLPAFTVMSCDNLQENGHVARNAVVGFARLLDASLADWIQANVSFPCTMVDRIVPAITEETQNDITTLLGVADPCGIACESFRQWVIEDDFVAGRPDWDLVGAEFVNNVVPFEEMKLRMLNGSHSFLAYLGYLAGYENIADTMADPAYKKAALALMLDEQAATLTMPEGTDLAAYASSLIDRYCNINIKHRTWQIAMDGSQKLPPRLLNSIRYHLKNGSDFKHLALAVAGWMRYVSGVDEQGVAIDVRDPMVESLKSICDQHGLNVSVVKALVSIDTIFAKDLIDNKVFMNAIETAYAALLLMGAQKSVAKL
ncbi:mannitol dehydrogenase family protein [Marinomonas primoryensis]|nr:fructuronate reductase [Marinomonas primoryensis]